MKLFFSIVLSFTCLLGSAQTSFLKEAAARLDKALIAKDTVVLKQLLHKDLRYGHTNGWIETRTEVIRDLATGKLSYTSIQSSNAAWTVTGDVATLRTNTDLAYALDGKPGTLHMHVLQVWLKTNKGWQLLTRQSTKI